MLAITDWLQMHDKDAKFWTGIDQHANNSQYPKAQSSFILGGSLLPPGRLKNALKNNRSFAHEPPIDRGAAAACTIRQRTVGKI
jgi:hypothetical protein